MRLRRYHFGHFIKGDKVNNNKTLKIQSIIKPVKKKKLTLTRIETTKTKKQEHHKEHSMKLKVLH